MDTQDDNVAAWIAEIQVHPSNFKNVPSELARQGIVVNEFMVFRFTALEISSFYALYRMAHKWKRTRIFVNNDLVTYSPNLTKVLKCCFDASEWPRLQNDWHKRNGRPEKSLELKHYCYGYDRTVYNIVGCQKIKAARDNRQPTGEQIEAIRDKEAFRNNREGWMNRRFIVRKESTFEVDLNVLHREISEELVNGPMICPNFVRERVSYGLDLLEKLTKSASHFWVIEDDATLNPRPIEYYFDMDIDKRIGSRFIHQHSLAYFVILSGILDLSLYETVLRVAVENPSVGFSIGFSDFRKQQLYVKFESLKQLGYE